MRLLRTCHREEPIGSAQDELRDAAISLQIVGRLPRFARNDSRFGEDEVMDCEAKGEVACKGGHYPVKVYAPA